MKKALLFLFFFAVLARADDSIIRHFRHQEMEGSCSLASATVLVNAFKGADSNLSEQQVLDLSGSTPWKGAIADDGDGLTLALMEGELKNLFSRLGFSNRIEVFHFDSEDAAAKWEETLKLLLREEVYVILNFDQAMILNVEGPMGHFSPVGAVDKSGSSILVLDTYAPMGRAYWVSRSAIERSMRAVDADSGRARGFIRIFK